MKKIILCIFMLMSACSVGRADDITFEATVNSPRVSLDEVLELTLTVTGVNDNLDPVSLPVIDGFTAKYVGPSTSVSIVNGVYHSERSFNYNLFPNKAGKFQIPSISATISGHNYTTSPIDVEVFTSSAQAQAQSPGETSDQSQAPNEQSIKNNILLMATFGKTDVYVNERVPLTIKLLYAIPIRDIQMPQFDKTGFMADDYEKPQQSAEIINGVKYDTVVFKTDIYPNHAGDLNFGPVQIQCNVLYKTRSENPLNQDNNPFGADIFNNFFDAYATRPITVNSEPVTLHVLSLPNDNRPDGFSGAIGQSFDFQAGVSPEQVKAGDPLTLKMDLKGDGNFNSLKMPEFQASGFKTYAPQIKNTSDEKTVEEVIIPTSTGISEVPALHFSYFDTSLKDYKTITQGPFAIHVTAPSPDQEFKAVGFTDISKTSTSLPVNQFSLGKLINQAVIYFKKLIQSTWFWVCFGIFLAVWVSYYIWQRFRDRLQNDPAFARRLKAVKEARQTLKLAEGKISTGNSKEFYALLSKALRDYLANKWHQSSAALSLEDISGHLKKAKLDEAHITQLKTLLERSDLVCFAGANHDASQMKTDLQQTQQLISRLEQHL